MSRSEAASTASSPIASEPLAVHGRAVVVLGDQRLVEVRLINQLPHLGGIERGEGALGRIGQRPEGMRAYGGSTHKGRERDLLERIAHAMVVVRALRAIFGLQPYNGHSGQHKRLMVAMQPRLVPELLPHAQRR